MSDHASLFCSCSNFWSFLIRLSLARRLPRLLTFACFSLSYQYLLQTWLMSRLRLPSLLLRRFCDHRVCHTIRYDRLSPAWFSWLYVAISVLFRSFWRVPLWIWPTSCARHHHLGTMLILACVRHVGFRATWCALGNRTVRSCLFLQVPESLLHDLCLISYSWLSQLLIRGGPYLP